MERGFTTVHEQLLIERNQTAINALQVEQEV